MLKQFQRLIHVIKFVLITSHILFAVFFVAFIIPKNGRFFNTWNLLFYGLLSLNMVLGILATLKELFATECISVVLTVVAIITCFTVEHHITVCLSLLVIFLLTFILSLLLYLKPKVLITFGGDDSHSSSPDPDLERHQQLHHNRRGNTDCEDAEENVWVYEIEKGNLALVIDLLCFVFLMEALTIEKSLNVYPQDIVLFIK